MRLLISALISGLFIVHVSAQPPTNFGSAKKSAVKLWWKIGPASFYCGCPYRPATTEEKMIRKGNLWVIGSVCGYQAKLPVTSSGKPNARATRIEWEHIVPADWIATGFNCQDKTRKECREITGYDAAEGDLFNLVPAVGELNQDRSARLFGEIVGEPRDYGSCDFEVTKTGTGEPHLRGAAEPKMSIRGDIARIWFYMSETYGVKLSASYKTMLDGWATSDPVDKAERIRHGVIAAEMGKVNPFVAGN